MRMQLVISILSVKYLIKLIKMLKIRWLFIFVFFVPLISYALTWSTVAQWLQSLNYDASAWAVVTKQTSVTSNQIASNDIQTLKLLSVALGAISQAERQKKIMIDYNANFGQPESNLCLSISQQNSFIKNMEQKNDDIKQRMTNFSNQIYISQTDLKNTLLTSHQDFCSINEAKQGLCKLKPNGMQAWDIDYSGFSSKNNLEGMAEIGALAYVKRLSASLAQTDFKCKSNSCKDLHIQNMTYAARSSMVTNTLLSQISIRKNSLL